MKTILLFITLLITLSGYGQDDCGKNHLGSGNVNKVWRRPLLNSIYGLYQVGDNGLGVRYDHYIINRLGAYGSTSRGKYWLAGMSKSVHYKFAAGVIVKTIEEDRARNFLYAGVSYHNFDSRQVKEISSSKLQSLSFEIGTGITVDFGFSLEFGYDFGETNQILALAGHFKTTIYEKFMFHSWL